LYITGNIWNGNGVKWAIAVACLGVNFGSCRFILVYCIQALACTIYTHTYEHSHSHKFLCKEKVSLYFVHVMYAIQWRQTSWHHTRKKTFLPQLYIRCTKLLCVRWICMSVFVTYRQHLVVDVTCCMWLWYGQCHRRSGVSFFWFFRLFVTSSSCPVPLKTKAKSSYVMGWHIRSYSMW
jgi:hypothetical protein